jgi:hypothetical protein
MATNATLVGRACPGSVVMTGGTILAQVGMHGMVKLDTVEQLGQGVERRLLRHIRGLGQAARRNEYQCHHQGGQDVLRAHGSLSFTMNECQTAFSFIELTGLLVHILVEHRESDEERDTDEIFDALDVLVKIHQGVNTVHLTNFFEYLGDHFLLLLCKTGR